MSVLFTDFRDFTRLVEQMTPQQVIEELSYCFTAFDDICDRHRLEKIKTIGDSYMAAGGLPRPNDTNPADAVSAALEILEWTENWKVEKLTRGEEPWEIRIGIHTGPVVAGVVGKTNLPTTSGATPSTTLPVWKAAASPGTSISRKPPTSWSGTSSTASTAAKSP
ncbi:MAG: adenylate/guanylate cyclase domain-containing protein [Haliscomenobacter sp.]|nr:adenylate/guanylate cyclase domain-containing protein [Haliscomenobacter sp.]